MAVALNNLGEIALALDDTAMAQLRFTRSSKLYRDLNDRGGLATAHKGLGDAASKAGQFLPAEQHYYKALTIGQEMNYVSLLLKIVCACGELFFHTNRTALSLSSFVLVLHHPGSDEACRVRSRDRLSQIGVPIAAPVEANWQTELSEECARLGLLLKTTSP